MTPVPSAVDAGRLAGPAGVGPAGPAGTHPGGRGEARHPSSPRVVTLAEGFVTLYLEVEAGRRPRSHLAGVMTPMLYARLSEVWVCGGAPGRVLGVRITGATPDGVDLVALVRRGRRCGAIAVHLVRSARGWLVDDVALPELGPLPLPPYPVPAGGAEDDDADDGLHLVPSVAAPPPPAPAVPPDWAVSRLPG